MFTLLRPELPKGFNQVFESAPGPEPQNNNQGSLPDLQVAGASGFYLPVAWSAEPGLARDSLSQGLTEDLVSPSGVGPHPIGPTSTINHPQPSSQRPPSVTAPFFVTCFNDNPHSLQPVCLLTISQMLHTQSTLQICLGGSYLPSPSMPHSFHSLKAFIAHIFLTDNNNALH